MNRRSFLRIIGLGALAGPIVAKNVLAGTTLPPEKMLVVPEAFLGDFAHAGIGLPVEEAFTEDVEFLPPVKYPGGREDLTDILTILEPEDSPVLGVFTLPKDYVSNFSYVWREQSPFKYHEKLSP